MILYEEARAASFVSVVFIFLPVGIILKVKPTNLLILLILYSVILGSILLLIKLWRDKVVFDNEFVKMCEDPKQLLEYSMGGRYWRKESKLIDIMYERFQRATHLNMLRGAVEIARGNKKPVFIYFPTKKYVMVNPGSNVCNLLLLHFPK